jgi:hypothetical protein
LLLQDVVGDIAARVKHTASAGAVDADIIGSGGVSGGAGSGVSVGGGGVSGSGSGSGSGAVDDEIRRQALAMPYTHASPRLPLDVSLPTPQATRFLVAARVASVVAVDAPTAPTTTMDTIRDEVA